jgi:DNA invertase Pin-like site-specific DNA recombinase
MRSGPELAELLTRVRGVTDEAQDELGAGLDEADLAHAPVAGGVVVGLAHAEELGAEIVAEYFDIGDSRSLPWARRPETGRLLADLRAKTNRWGAIVVGEFTRAFGAPIQYSTTYPLLQHFGIELWLPEIGGRVDYSSATSEMLLGMLGGTSKQERDLIRTRVREGMGVLAKEGQRHLGGRPPYGYLLADAGEHPNAKKRALGQRLHRLEPDPVTGPVVRRIFEMYASGQGQKQIANNLTAEGVPSPSAHDRKRDPHRDPRGWAHTAIRAILINERLASSASMEL